MADYIGWVITNKGRELLAKVINHETRLNITKLEIGSGYNTGNDRELTALINAKNIFLVNSYERKDNASVEFTFIVSNRATSGDALNREAYQIKEMGIFASDDAGVEVLYAYNKGTNGDYLPVFNGKNQIDIIEKCIITIDQQADMNVNIDNSITYVTYEGLRRELDKKINKTDLATETEAGLITLAKIKELEDAKMSQMMGADYGGLLQTPGQKEMGKTYYDTVNKQMVYPIENNNLTYYETTKFIPISGLQNAKNVENLSNIETYSIDPKLTVGIIQKIGNICILTVDSGVVYNGKNYGEVLFNVPEKFRPKLLIPVSAGVLNSTIGGAAQIERNGNVVWRGGRITNSVYINAVYLVK